MMGAAQRTVPVIVAMGGTSSAANTMPTGAVMPTPSSRAMKSRCQKSRRYSPSVTTRRPSASCFATAARMYRPSTSLSSAAVRAPAFALLRASRSSGGRSRLPTWSARNGGVVTISVEDHAAVDVEGLAGDIARAGRGEEDGEGGDVLRIVGTPERDRRVAPALHLLDRHALDPRPRGYVGLRQRGHRGARAHGVDVDVVPGELLGGGTRQRDHAALAGGVDGVRGAGVALAGDGRDVHDDAALPRDHLARHALQAEEHALGVHAHDAVPVRLGELHDVGAARDARVVDEDVD